MKAILKTLLFLLTVVILSQCKKDVEPNTVTIHDDNFLNALIELGVDTNGDSIISSAEAEAITYLDVSGTYGTPGEIEDMQGIEAFINLDTLYCSYNQLTTLDISNNTALVSLHCGSNLLTVLDVSNNTALIRLHCWGNQLSTLDVSNNTALRILDCDSNQLFALDVSNNTALTNLYCARNQLTSLDVSNNTTLIFLYCPKNKLTTLDLSNNIILTSLLCDRNQLTSLNVSNSTALEVLNCEANQLTSLDVSNNTALGTWPAYGFPDLNISQMLTLYQVCVWEMPFPPAGVEVDTTNSPNVYFTMDCSK